MLPTSTEFPQPFRSKRLQKTATGNRSTNQSVAGEARGLELSISRLKVHRSMQLRVQFFRARRDNIVSFESELNGAEVGEQIAAWLRAYPDGRIQLAANGAGTGWCVEPSPGRSPAGRAPGAFGRQLDHGYSHDAN